MDNLIYIWVVNRLLEFCQYLSGAGVVITGLALLFFAIAHLDAAINEIQDDSKLRCRHLIKKWLIWSFSLTLFFGILSVFKLNRTEFKTVAVYLIGKEIVQSDRGEKIITIIDNKLDEWIKKIEK